MLNGADKHLEIYVSPFTMNIECKCYSLNDWAMWHMLPLERKINY